MDTLIYKQNDMSIAMKNESQGRNVISFNKSPN